MVSVLTGGSGDCSERADAYEEYLESRKTVKDSEEDDECDEYAGEVYDECVDAGGSVEECGAQAEEAYGECVGERGQETEDEREWALRH